jgi:RNA recognition motif-containing protein
MAALLIVDGLALDVTPERLKMEFGAYGEVEWAKIVTDHYGKSLAFAYIQMGSVQAADDAQKALDGSTVLVLPIRVDHSKTHKG